MLAPTRLVLALMLGVASPAMAPADGPAASLPRSVAAIAMTWRIDREVGADDRSCFLIARGGDVVVRLYLGRDAAAAVWSVLVGFESQPGTVRYLRINKTYFTTAEAGFRDAEAETIVGLLKAPGEFAFEWFKWPNAAKQVGLYGTGDFAAKAAACEAWIDSGQSAAIEPSLDRPAAARIQSRSS